MTDTTNEVVITELEQQVARILSGNGEVIGDLINLLRNKQTEIDGLTTLATATKANLATLESRVNELDGFLNENWEEMNHLGINEDIAKIFNLEIEQETEVTFNITGTATIKHPRGTDLEDMDMSELIDCDIVTRDYTYEIQDYEIETISGN
jgi:hypothetical protein